ncbi:MAG: molecular chaperone GrpE [Candidatus Nanohaloarchaea archaeon]|jgi:molecular chaperone GrpE
MSYDELSREQLEEALKTLEEEVDELKEEKKDWEEKAKKVKADFENYKKDESERKQRWKKEAERDLAEEMIEIMDNLERAIASADEDSGVVQGVKMVADQLYDKLEKKGLQRIEAEGEEFDPELHKAVDTEEHEDENKVLKQKRKGYMFDDEVLREAEVVVSKDGTE